ncbi:aspartate ammonia-lyase [Defluviimonas salinarum]|uniref:Aspartate ammonia-lyase n=1 Tax=Defluviimonas salinarum TaxID=2992147 RepID=A0ABT3J8A2_9RHOB|nr:aspartate ammonia-lyase [Defluviimonas salinarum]MCW3783609.1 aspartate ammonia-lyase [Defluviimonas salinarum]
MTQTYRTERDSLGEVQVPASAMYGAHTERARGNFQFTALKLSDFPELVVALAMIKKAAALTNRDLGVLSAEKSQAICEACEEVIGGQHHDQFVVDMVQGGAGTSTNMNANEVIANAALAHLGLPFGDYRVLHPNDDVNRSQSTNDVYPSALRLAMLAGIGPLKAAISSLVAAFNEKADEFRPIMKVGRTQLQDAVPISLGDEFAAFAVTFSEDCRRIDEVAALLHEINLGGTAVGTGTNTPTGYAPRVIEELSRISGRPLRLADNLIEASSELGDIVMFSGMLKRIAVKISKVCNDLRLLSSGPRAGIGELVLPPIQAGSSIMPGKVNPVIPEVVNQVAFQVIGNDLTVTLAAEAGQLQLNAMEPIAALNVLQSMRMLSRAFEHLAEKCVRGIKADEQRCASLLANSLVNAVDLVHQLGYERAARVAKHAMTFRCTLVDSLCEVEGLSYAEAAQLLQ